MNNEEFGNIKFLFVVLFLSAAVAAEKTNTQEFEYQQLKRDWLLIFPDGNRNASGPKLFKSALNISKDFTEFQMFNKLFCPVSGSLINPNSIPEFVYINEEGSSRGICGQLSAFSAISYYCRYRA